MAYDLASIWANEKKGHNVFGCRSYNFPILWWVTACWHALHAPWLPHCNRRDAWRPSHPCTHHPCPAPTAPQLTTAWHCRR